MSPHSLTARLQALSDTYKQTLILIQRLQKLPYAPGTASTEEDPRVELSSEIHQSLKEQEDALELLRQEVEDDATATGGRWVGGGSVMRRRDGERAQEHESIAATVARLGEDLKSARASFRRAQLEAKRNQDAARRKERELLFANRSNDTETHPPTRRKGQEKLTQDEIAMNASNDVTAALRRTHDLLQNNLQQSQFVQETLDESSNALASLSESYTGLGDLLKSSKGLAGQLLRSQKSDTWYLETAFYILVMTIAWLVFRRIFYGPFWWLVWQPLRLAYWILVTTLSAIGTLGSQKAFNRSRSEVHSVSTARLNSRGIPTIDPGRSAPYMMVGAKGGGWGLDRSQDSPAAKEASLVDRIGEMAEKSHGQVTSVGMDVKGTDRDAHAEPRNSKKRMFEKEVEDRKPRDEL